MDRLNAWPTTFSTHFGFKRLARYRGRPNTNRLHWALNPEIGGDPRVPAEDYTGRREIDIPQ